MLAYAAQGTTVDLGFSLSSIAQHREVLSLEVVFSAGFITLYATALFFDQDFDQVSTWRDVSAILLACKVMSRRSSRCGCRQDSSDFLSSMSWSV